MQCTKSQGNIFFRMKQTYANYNFSTSIPEVKLAKWAKYPVPRCIEIADGVRRISTSICPGS